MLFKNKMSTTLIQGVFGFTLEYVLPWEGITHLMYVKFSEELMEHRVHLIIQSSCFFTVDALITQF